MDKLLKLLLTHNDLLKLHIRTKTVCSQFHEKSAAWYEFAFDAFHKLAEKRQDLGIDAPADEDSSYQSYYDYLLILKSVLNDMVKEKNSTGLDNLLRGLIDELEWHIGDAKAFLNEEKDEYETSEEKTEKGLKPKK